MKFVAAKCPACGGSLQVPDEKDFVICMYCGQSIKVRDAIVVKPFANDVNLISLGFNFLEEGNLYKAEEYFNKGLEENTRNAMGWLGKVIVILKSNRLGRNELNFVNEYSKKALDFAESNEKGIILSRVSEAVYSDYYTQESVIELLTLNATLGNNNENILKKIIEISDTALCNHYEKGSPVLQNVFPSREAAMKELHICNEELYNKFQNEFNIRYRRALVNRKLAIDSIVKKYHNIENVLLVIVFPLATFIVLFVLVSILFSLIEVPDFFGFLVMFAPPVVFLIVTPFAFLRKTKQEKFSKIERYKFGYNIIYK